MTVTLNQIYAKFQFIADSNGMIKDFMIAQAAEVSADRATTYPLLMVLELPYSIVGTSRQHRFRCMVMDRLYPDNPGANRNEVLSDTHGIALDVLAKLKGERDLWAFDRNSVQLESFEGRFLDDVAGWSFDIGLNVAHNWDECQVPGAARQPIPPSPPSERAAPPTFTIPAGIYPLSASVGIETNEPSGLIYFTDDGTTPNSQDDLYVTPTTIFGDKIFQARVLAPGKLPSPVASASYGITGANVTIDPNGGMFSASGLPVVSLLSNLIGAEIRYTLDGSAPTSGSTLYSTPLTIDRNRVLRAIAILNPFQSDPAASATFEIKALPPVVDTTTGIYESQRTVTATNPNPLGTIQYRLNGGAWIDGNSVTRDVTTVIDWRVSGPEYVTSDVVSVTVTIQCAQPTISPNGGIFEGTQAVTIGTVEAGGVTHYTTNGAIPTQSDPTTTPFNITATTQVRARTFRAGTEPSVVVSATFNLFQRFELAGVRLGTTGQRRLYLFNGTSWSQIQPLGNVDADWEDSQISFGSQYMLAATATTNRLLHTLNSGASWQLSTFAGALASAPVPRADKTGQYVWCIASLASGGSTLHRSTDFGVTFQQISPLGFTNFGGVDVDKENPNIVYASRAASTSGELIFRSLDGGNTWSLVYTEANRNVTSLVVAGNKVFFGIRNSLSSAFVATVRSLDGGNTWSNLVSQLDLFALSLDGNVFIGRGQVAQNQLFRSTDNGASFSLVASVNSGTIFRIAEGTDPNRFIVGTSTRLFRSLDAGATFTQQQPVGNVDRTWQLAAI